ncbi:uncharacterized protein [Dysidea avara]|uniref:uncharacterized protein isoform X2 n=1 Tax=Dysidea avara TaxID=196820 RepID=UPI00332B0BBB
MDRDTSCLRCSKLTCYAEFNRMLNAVAKHGSGSSRNGHATTASVVNGRDYCFSAALATMLKHVASNPDEKDQKKELESVHDWYLANKPLLFSSKSRTTRKPAIHVTSTDQKEISRPQTAPALLNEAVVTEDEKLKTSEMRPHTTFTTNYMSTVLGITRGEATIVPTIPVVAKRGLEQRCQSANSPTKLSTMKPTSRNRRRSLQPALMSKVIIPGRGDSVAETYRQLNFGEVYDFASEVAGQMIAEKQQVEQCRQTVKSFLVSRPSSTKDAMAKESTPSTTAASKSPKKCAPLEASEGSSIKVSFSQDNLLKTSPQRKLLETSSIKNERPSTTPADLSRSLPTITEKNVTPQAARAASSKGGRCQDKCSSVKIQVYNFPDNRKTTSHSELVKHPKPLMPCVAGFNTKRYAINIT